MYKINVDYIKHVRLLDMANEALQQLDFQEG